MTQDIHGCPYPSCDAGHMLAEKKEADDKYRGEIKGQLTSIDSAIRDMVRTISDAVTSNKLVEQSVRYLNEERQRNEKAHDLLFEKIAALENRTGARMWDMVRLLITLGAGLLIGKLT
jgi:hypothetical protein